MSEPAPVVDRSVADRPDESGLGLVEVIVAMVLLAMFAMSFLPLLARSAGAAATGTTVVTAGRLVSDQMEQVRATGSVSCPADNDDAVIDTLTDPRGVVLQVRTDVVLIEGSCAGGQKALLRFEASVTRSTAPTVDVAAATTLIAVSAP
jgi:type II secretory pathway pseudopilin PulG